MTDAVLAHGKLTNTPGSWIGAAIAFTIFGVLLIFKRGISRDKNGVMHEEGAHKVGVLLLVVATLCVVGAFTVP